MRCLLLIWWHPSGLLYIRFTAFSDWKPMSSDDDHQLIVQIIYVQYMGIKSTERDYIPLSINSSEIQIIITTQAK